MTLAVDWAVKPQHKQKKKESLIPNGSADKRRTELLILVRRFPPTVQDCRLSSVIIFVQTDQKRWQSKLQILFGIQQANYWSKRQHSFALVLYGKRPAAEGIGQTKRDQ